MKELNKYSLVDRCEFFIGNGWQGIRVHEMLISQSVGSMEYDIISKDDKTFVVTWSKECEDVLKNNGYRALH